MPKFDYSRRSLARLSSPRAQFAALALIAALQKAPSLLRGFNSLKFSLEPATRILQKLTLTATSLGAYHALSGATTAVYSTSPDPPFDFEIDEELTIAFGVSNTDADAQSWSVSGSVPPGLTISGTLGEPLSDNGNFNAQFGKIAGRPTQAGVFTFFLKPWKNRNATGNTAEAFEVTITVTSPEAVPLETPKATIEVTSESVIVTWTTTDGQAYELQHSDNPLDETSWTPFPAELQTEANQQSTTIEKASFASPLILRVATNRSAN